MEFLELCMFPTYIWEWMFHMVLVRTSQELQHA